MAQQQSDRTFSARFSTKAAADLLADAALGAHDVVVLLPGRGRLVRRSLRRRARTSGPSGMGGHVAGGRQRRRGIGLPDRSASDVPSVTARAGASRIDVGDLGPSPLGAHRRSEVAISLPGAGRGGLPARPRSGRPRGARRGLHGAGPPAGANRGPALRIRRRPGARSCRGSLDAPSGAGGPDLGRLGARHLRRGRRRPGPLLRPAASCARCGRRGRAARAAATGPSKGSRRCCPLKQKLILPRSSLTTTTTASVSSVIPSAARWREPSWASSTLVSGIGEEHAGPGDAPEVADEGTAPSCSLLTDSGTKSDTRELARHHAVEVDALRSWRTPARWRPCSKAMSAPMRWRARSSVGRGDDLVDDAGLLLAPAAEPARCSPCRIRARRMSFWKTTTTMSTIDESSEERRPRKVASLKRFAPGRRRAARCRAPPPSGSARVPLEHDAAPGR